MKLFQRKPSEYFTKMFNNMTKSSIEQDIIEIRNSVRQTIQNSEKAKVKDIMAVIKKIIKEKIEASYKFFALLILRDIMESKKDFVVDYFVKKLSDRLIKIAKYRERKNEAIEIRGQTCLNE